MRSFSGFFFILFFISVPAQGEDAGKDYAKQVDKISAVFDQSLQMINDGRQEAYTDELSRKYDEMVADIYRGGDGHLYGEMQKFVPAKIPKLEDYGR